MRNLTVVVIAVFINLVTGQFGSLQLGGGQQQPSENVNAGSRGQDFVFPDFIFPDSKPQNYFAQTPSRPQAIPDRFNPSSQLSPSRLDERPSQTSKRINFIFITKFITFCLAFSWIFRVRRILKTHRKKSSSIFIVTRLNNNGFDCWSVRYFYGLDCWWDQSKL